MKYEIGSRIRYFRELRGMNQKELAEKIGVSNSRVSNWEQGINRPDADILVLLCRALGVSADELLSMNTAVMQLTPEEKTLVTRYRDMPEIRHAVRILLNMEKDGDSR